MKSLFLVGAKLAEVERKINFKMNLNKKGEIFNLTKEWILWIVRAIVFFVIFSIIIIIIYIPLFSQVNADGLKHSLLRQHLIYDKNCLAYENDKVYPGIVDIKKFNKDNLEKCFNSQDHGVQVTLNNHLIKLNEKLNKFEFCFDKKSFYCSNQTFYILIKNNDKTEQGKLNIAIMNQK